MYSVCTRLTQVYLLVEYKVFSNKVQLHVSALANGHVENYLYSTNKYSYTSTHTVH